MSIVIISQDLPKFQIFLQISREFLEVECFTSLLYRSKTPSHESRRLIERLLSLWRQDTLKLSAAMYQHEGGLPWEEEKKLINNSGIPQHEIEAIARILLPDILVFYESEEGQREFAEWKMQQDAERQHDDMADKAA